MNAIFLFLEKPKKKLLILKEKDLIYNNYYSNNNKLKRDIIAITFYRSIDSNQVNLL